MGRPPARRDTGTVYGPMRAGGAVLMKVTMHNTSKIVELVGDNGTVPARVWEGHTEGGIPVIAFITRIAAERGEDLAEFERDLAEQTPPSAAVQSFPVRMIL